MSGTVHKTKTASAHPAEAEMVDMEKTPEVHLWGFLHAGLFC